jgi:hypothetical protein
MAWSDLRQANELRQNGRYEQARAKLTLATGLSKKPEVQSQARELSHYLENTDRSTN